MHSSFLKASLIFLLIVSASAQAEGARLGFRGWGPRVGITVDPDQVHFGAHADFGNFANRVRFQPNFELGIGDHYTVGAANFEINYRFHESWNVWSPYLGGGMGVFFTRREREGFPDRSDTESGLTVLGGIEKGISQSDRLFLEAKLGLSDAPDFKLTLGWTFGR